MAFPIWRPPDLLISNLDHTYPHNELNSMNGVFYKLNGAKACFMFVKLSRDVNQKQQSYACFQHPFHLDLALCLTGYLLWSCLTADQASTPSWSGRPMNFGIIANRNSWIELLSLDKGRYRYALLPKISWSFQSIHQKLKADLHLVTFCWPCASYTHTIIADYSFRKQIVPVKHWFNSTLTEFKLCFFWIADSDGLP